MGHAQVGTHLQQEGSKRVQAHCGKLPRGEDKSGGMGHAQVGARPAEEGIGAAFLGCAFAWLLFSTQWHCSCRVRMHHHLAHVRMQRHLAQARMQHHPVLTAGGSHTSVNSP